MGRKSLYLLIVGIFVAYYTYTPIPDNFEEPWRLMLINTPLKTFQNLVSFFEFLGFYHLADLIALSKAFLEVPPTSDENVTVTETTFDNVPVRVYVPKRKVDAQRRAVFYIHGGGWCSGSPALYSYDLLSRWTAERLDAVVISIDYRLAPKYHFPIQFEDTYNALRWFLRKNVLENYDVNPERICVSGDSAGGNLAAAVTQQSLQTLQPVLTSIHQLIRQKHPDLPSETPLKAPTKPGIPVLVQWHHRDSLKPHWEGPFTVVLSTPTTIKVAQKTAWIHHTHVKPLEATDSEECSQLTVQQTGNPLKLKLTKAYLDYARHELF
ncbi:arylacetamide deacetylase-like isoform X2 [Cavia porcellus]|uniref:arylacetamide deacetylase-like isoform X2 n=1 Tax=Cavia porcellus TaxID=10141 RepID=UPI000661F3A7